ncbi:MAG: lytic murein transglycosylase [Rhizobacter sp.]|nr:lytic murein transglycosylase [Rhizobacter sp.]
MPPPAGTAEELRAAYRERFVEPRRIRAGVAFWRANEGWLLRAEDIYGVPPEIVVGIIGVETIYGEQMGNFRVIDALATLAFDFLPAARTAAARRTRAVVRSMPCDERAHRLRPARAKGQLRRRAGHAAVHAGQRQQVRGGLRCRWTHRPAREQRRRDRQRRALPRRVRLAARPA